MGRLEPPAELRLFDRSGRVPVKRFPIDQGGKVRLCDYLRRTGANEYASHSAKIDLPGVDVLAQIPTNIQSAAGRKATF